MADGDYERRENRQSELSRLQRLMDAARANSAKIASSSSNVQDSKATKRIIALLASALVSSCCLSMPRIASQAELVADGALKMKVLANAHGVPPPSPLAHSYTLTENGKRRSVKWYSAGDLWRLRAFAGMWKDKEGNTLTLARVISLPPEIAMPSWFSSPEPMSSKEEIDSALDKAEKAFTSSPEALAAWRNAWGTDPNAHGIFTDPKNGVRYYIELNPSSPIKPKDAEKLVSSLAKSISCRVGGTSANNSSMKWWKDENAEYIFWTNQDRAKGGKFIKDTMSLMSAMRRAYELYVPPKRTIGKCTVRIFKTLADYKEYLAGTTSGEFDFSCGLWDPSREELLIVAENPEQALKTMRHEAFHQYLHYATGCGHHALWFNEGHACFFENVKYDPAKKKVHILDTGSRSSRVASSPDLIASQLSRLVRKDRSEFYSGDINMNYVCGWALVYFLEKGAYTATEFECYRKVVSAYLEAIESGNDAAAATRIAFAGTKSRNLAEDFLAFWRKHRKAALKARD